MLRIRPVRERHLHVPKLPPFLPTVRTRRRTAATARARSRGRRNLIGARAFMFSAERRHQAVVAPMPRNRVVAMIARSVRQSTFLARSTGERLIPGADHGGTTIAGNILFPRHLSVLCAQVGLFSKPNPFPTAPDNVAFGPRLQGISTQPAGAIVEIRGKGALWATLTIAAQRRAGVAAGSRTAVLARRWRRAVDLLMDEPATRSNPIARRRSKPDPRAETAVHIVIVTPKHAQAARVAINCVLLPGHSFDTIRRRLFYETRGKTTEDYITAIWMIFSFRLRDRCD